MKIMIDATSLARTITGIENYTKNLVLNIIRLNDPKENELYILFRKEVPSYLKDIKGYTPLVCPLNSQLFCEQFWIPYINLTYKPEVIHFPAFPPPLFLFNKGTHFTVHDATMWKFPETLSLKNKLYMKPLSNLGIKKSKTIFTVSEASVSNILDVFPSLKNKLVNSGLSISSNFKPETDEDLLNEVKVTYKLPERYFLTVGSIEPRKNLIFLIKSFIEFKKRFNNDYKLVITGRAAWGSAEIKEIIENSHVGDSILFTGYVSDEDLVSLYTLASCFVYPSIYEGFGLPVLESMACGTPVIISDSSSLPEVGGNAALYFNPYKQDELIELLEKFVFNGAIRDELRNKGLERSKFFSWKKVSKIIFEEYLKK
ncbi:glycosyltransferase family 4 protein [Robertmurraya sp. GLU-23]